MAPSEFDVEAHSNKGDTGFSNLARQTASLTTNQRLSCDTAASQGSWWLSHRGRSDGRLAQSPINPPPYLP
jgi:hypothetical protein